MPARHEAHTGLAPLFTEARINRTPKFLLAIPDATPVTIARRPIKSIPAINLHNGGLRAELGDDAVIVHHATGSCIGAQRF
jgi:hypothetical protein